MQLHLAGLWVWGSGRTSWLAFTSWFSLVPSAWRSSGVLVCTGKGKVCTFLQGVASGSRLSREGSMSMPAPWASSSTGYHAEHWEAAACSRPGSPSARSWGVANADIPRKSLVRSCAGLARGFLVWTAQASVQCCQGLPLPRSLVPAAYPALSTGLRVPNGKLSVTFGVQGVWSS